MTTPLIEAIARAIYTQSYRNCCGGELPDANDDSWRSYLSEAQAALTAIADAGYAVVPCEPTEAMLEAMRKSEREHGRTDAIYRAMIQATQGDGE